MNFSNTTFLKLLSVLLVIAAVALALSATDRRKERNTADHEVSRPGSQRETPRRNSSAPLQLADVVKMTPKDWTDRFRKSPSEISAEYEQEILKLAEELSEILRQNPDPNGEEALVFSETILTLLEERGGKPGMVASTPGRRPSPPSPR